MELKESILKAIKTGQRRFSCFEYGLRPEHDQEFEKILKECASSLNLTVESDEKMYPANYQLVEKCNKEHDKQEDDKKDDKKENEKENEKDNSTANMNRKRKLPDLPENPTRKQIAMDMLLRRLITLEDENQEQQMKLEVISKMPAFLIKENERLQQQNQSYLEQINSLKKKHRQIIKSLSDN